MSSAPDRFSRRYTRALLCRAIIEPESVFDLDPGDLELLIRLCRRAQILGRLAAHLDESPRKDQLPPVVLDQLSSARATVDARARDAGWELDRIAKALEGIDRQPLIALKGCAYLIARTPNAVGRMFADVDLMFPEQHLADVEAQLRSDGWVAPQMTPYDQNYYRRWTHELPPLRHVERGVEIDLHHNILPPTARHSPDADKLVAASVPTDFTPYQVLSPQDMVLHATVHLTISDDFAERVRELIDIADLADHFRKRDSEFWDKLAARSAELGLQRALYYACRYAERWLSLEIPTRAKRAIEASGPTSPVRFVMDFLIAGSLFPTHPDRPDRWSGFCRSMLLLRSHWLRMPLRLLAYHFGHKYIYQKLRPSRAEAES